MRWRCGRCADGIAAGVNDLAGDIGGANHLVGVPGREVSHRPFIVLAWSGAAECECSFLHPLAGQYHKSIVG